MKPLLVELSHFSARQIAAELNRRGINSAAGGQESFKTELRRGFSFQHRARATAAHRPPPAEPSAMQGAPLLPEGASAFSPSGYP
jgi:hypothetical protein